ncbi:MAG: shikimate kinase [Sneathiella sp.]|nr:shikimate kinase [Sneathiella sp.]
MKSDSAAPISPPANTIDSGNANIGSKTIVLVGLMGAGKSSVGRRLAAELNLPFKDADAEIEQASNLSVPEFFDIHGEKAFRDGERKVISRLLSENQHILATGGGAYMDMETREIIAQNGISVWLRADLDTILKRCMKRNTRPLLRKGNPRQILDTLMKERYPIYNEANIVVDSADGPHQIVVSKIIDALRDHQENKAL